VEHNHQHQNVTILEHNDQPAGPTPITQNLVFLKPVNQPSESFITFSLLTLTEQYSQTTADRNTLVNIKTKLAQLMNSMHINVT